MVPALGPNHGAQRAAQVHGFGVGPPGPAQPEAARRRVAADAAAAEYVAKPRRVGRGSGRDEAALLAENLAVLKPRRAGAENEIHRPFDVAALVKLPAAAPIRVQRVLKPQKPAIHEGRFVAIHPHGHRLPHRPRRVLKRQVLGRKIRPVDVAARRARRALVFPKNVFLLVIVVVGKNRSVPVLANKLHQLLGARQHQLFLVRALFDENGGDFLPKIGHGIKRLLHRAKLAAAVLRHHKIVGPGPAQAAETQKHKQQQILHGTVGFVP